MNIYDIIIIGGGPAGLTAAIYAARTGKSVIVFERNVLGGQITFAPLVENYPGIPQLNGSEFAAALEEQASSLGAVISYEEVLNVEPATGKYKVITDAGQYHTKAIIVAIGAAHKHLGLPNEEALIGAGVSYCAVCDGAFYADKEVAVVGGGNAAVQEALFLSTMCSKVHLVHRRNQLRADNCTAKRLLNNSKIVLHTPYTINEILDNGQELKGVVLKNTETKEELSLTVDGLFIAIGQEADNTAIKGLNICSANGYLKAEANTETILPGVFAAGDCRDKDIRQLTTACADGTIAALAACKYLEN